jgi:hypothetical protein
MSTHPGNPKILWTSLKDNPNDVKKAAVKARLLTGTYTLQANRAKCNQNEVDPTCKTCGLEAEDRKHFLLRCQALNEVREKYISKLFASLSTTLRTETVETIKNSEEILLQLLIDCTKQNLAKLLGSNLDLSKIETLSRNMCYALHKKRDAIHRDLTS